MLSGHLRETIMRVYDTHPKTAESIMDIAEMVDSVAKREYLRGRKDQSEKSIQWIPCSDRLPDDWVIAVLCEKDTGFQLIPRIMKYSKSSDDWIFLDDFLNII